MIVLVFPLWIFVINSIKQIQNNLKHQRTEISRLVPFAIAVVLSVANLVSLV